MKLKTIFLSLFWSFFLVSAAFSQTASSGLYERAQNFMRTGDYPNAIIVLKRALESEPENAQYKQTLAYAYALTKEFKPAQKLINEVIKSDDANVQAYQIAGNIYKAQNDSKGAIKNFKKGLQQFPESAVLYSEIGQAYYDAQDFNRALQSWLEGIRQDAEYAPNYYFAARLYYYSLDKFWTVVYGEIFINLERYTDRTSEMKTMLLDAYKTVVNESLKVAGEADRGANTDRPDFKTAVLITLDKSADVALSRGITPESLTMVRTQFLLHWDEFYKLLYPYKLFDFYRGLLSNGLFEAYNQWVFGPAADPSVYKRWVKQHEDLMNTMIDYLNDHSLQPDSGQFYQTGDFEFAPKVLMRK